MSKHMTTNDVERAINLISQDTPYADELRTLMQRAWVKAIEDEQSWEIENLPHLRTFLKTTPLGLAIVDLAHAIIATEGD